MTVTKGLAEVKEFPCSDGGTMKFLLVSGTGVAVMCGKVGGSKVEKANAHRIAALWNMAERLELTTEEIESGNVEAEIKAATDMLEALEGVVALTENFPVCPFCGCALDHRPNCLSHEIDAAIRKAKHEIFQYNFQ